MKYAIVKQINGNYFIHAEGITDVSNAKTQFHGLCETLWNAPDVITAEIAIVDENLDNVEGYKEYISHKPVISYVEITDLDAVAEEGVTYYVLINNEYVADTGVQTGDRVFGKYVVAE